MIPIFGYLHGKPGLWSPWRRLPEDEIRHRGSNQPVRGTDGRILITSQNHGFVIDVQTCLKGADDICKL